MGYERKIGFIHYIRGIATEKQLIILLSITVGVLCGIVSLILKWLIHLVQHFVQHTIVWESRFAGYIVFPLIGIMLTALLVRYIVRDDISHGITKVLYAISQRKSIIKVHNIWSNVVCSAITIGFGGSVGAEAPIVLTGSAIGSNLAKFFRLSQRTMMLMIGCGAAAAIGGVFKAPIAGLVFAVEVLLVDLTMSNVAPLLLSSITATITTCLFTDSTPLFQIEQPESFQLYRIPWYVLLGIICGFVSLYFTKVNNSLESCFKKYVPSFWGKIWIGGGLLGILIWTLPSLYGEGYDIITQIINGNSMHTEKFNSFFISSLPGQIYLLLFFLLNVLFKVIACVCTNAGGGVGGIFAPSLFTGAFCGAFVAQILLTADIGVSTANFSLVGMAGLISGVMHAPLTGVFLIAELTGGYHLFIPLIIVAIISYQTIRLFEPHSLYATRLAQKGELLTHNKDKAVLTLLKMNAVIETNFSTITPQMLLGDLVKTISQSSRNIFPVIDKNQHLVGILQLDDVRNIMFQQRLYKRFTVNDLMSVPEIVLNDKMSMERIMHIFEDTDAWNLPVVNEHSQYIGFVSKSKIFDSYRRVLVHFSED